MPNRGTDQAGESSAYNSMDPSRPSVVVARYRQASEQQIKRCVDTATSDPAGWRSLSCDARYELLRRVAQEIRVRRADLIGAALADGGKTILESDPEVSEAIDFVEFYAKTALELQKNAKVRARAKVLSL